MEQKTIIRILAAYGLTARRFLEPQKGYRNTSYGFEASDGRMYNLILYKDEPGIVERIQGADRVSGFLASNGHAVRRPLGKIVRLQAGQTGRYARLYNYLPGSTIPWEAYTMGHIKLLGASLSALHSSLQNFDAGSLPDVADDSRRLLGEMAGYFTRPGVAEASSKKLQLDVSRTAFVAIGPILESASRAGRNRALHMDFVRGNILFSGKPPAISGILDFEKTAAGPAVFDVARTLAFLLVDCKYKQPDKIYKYFILSGYQKHGPYKMDERQLDVLGGLVKFYLLHDFYKFLKHNPYESLGDNEHFVRTRDILVKDGIISRITPVRDRASRR